MLREHCGVQQLFADTSDESAGPADTSDESAGPAYLLDYAA